MLTPTYLFDMGFPTPSAGGGWLGRSFDPFPVVRNQMMSASPGWTGELPVPSGMALAAGMTARQDHLQRDDAIEFDLPSFVNHAHAAAAQLAEKLEAGDIDKRRTRTEGNRLGR